MANTKIGRDQINKPAPLWYRRLTNAMILCFVPAYVALVQVLRMDDYTRNILMCISAIIPFLMKGIGMILGNGEYVKENAAEDPASNTANKNASLNSSE